MGCNNCSGAQTYSSGRTDIYSAGGQCMRSYDRGNYRVDSQTSYRDAAQVGFPGDYSNSEESPL